MNSATPITFSYFQHFFSEHQKNYSFDSSDGLAVIALGLAGETGEVIEIIKKFIRDTELNRENLKLELGDVLAYLSVIASYFDLTLEDISQAAIEKNIHRFKQGTLQSDDEKR